MNQKISTRDYKVIARFLNGHPDDGDLFMAVVGKNNDVNPTLMLQGSRDAMLIHASRIIAKLKEDYLVDPDPAARKAAPFIIKIAEHYSHPLDEKMAKEAAAALEKLEKLNEGF